MTIIRKKDHPMENVAHYYPEDIPADIKALADNRKLRYPMFEGQGCTKNVGSDAYGYYITKIKSAKLIGLVNACSKMHSTWEEGTLDCWMPSNKQPTMWLTKYGKKWYACDENGKNRDKGRPFYLSFNGCYEYRDPSF